MKLVQFSSVAQSCLTLCDPMNCSTPGLRVHHQLPEFTQTNVRRVRDAIQPSHPLSSPSLPAFNLSQHQGLFKWVTSSHEVAKVLEFQLQCQSFQWILGLISFRMDWLDLLTVQGTLKSLLQHLSSKASILWCSAFFIVQLSYPYMTTGKMLMIAFVFLFCLLFGWGVLHSVLLVVGWCRVLYSSGFLCVSSRYLILPRVSSASKVMLKILQAGLQ